MAQNIFLIGFMGAGKSTAARAISARYGLRAIEMDEEIEARQGRSVSQIFEEEGEPFFRDLETQLLKSLQREENVVVSCGGGVPMRQENVSLMRRCGTIVYLSAAPETIYARVKDTHTRPLLEEDMSPEHIRDLMSRRLRFYQDAADVTIATDGRSVDEICQEIINTI